MSKDIYFFIQEEQYGFLSNFFRAKQVVDGVTYDSNERYYQCQKARTPEIRKWVYNAPSDKNDNSPFLAMVAGHGFRIGREARADWTVQVRLATMLKGLRAKFNQNPDLAKLLLATGDAILHENNPDDPFWGIGNEKNRLRRWDSKCGGPKGCGYRGPDEEFHSGKDKRPKCPKCGKNHTFMCIPVDLGDNLGKLLMQVRQELQDGQKT